MDEEIGCFYLLYIYVTIRIAHSCCCTACVDVKEPVLVHRNRCKKEKKKKDKNKGIVPVRSLITTSESQPSVMDFHLYRKWSENILRFLSVKSHRETASTDLIITLAAALGLMLI